MNCGPGRGKRSGGGGGKRIPAHHHGPQAQAPSSSPNAPASAHSAMPFTFEDHHDAPKPCRRGDVVWWTKVDGGWQFMNQAWVIILEEAIQAGRTTAVVHHPYAGRKKTRPTSWTSKR